MSEEIENTSLSLQADFIRNYTGWLTMDVGLLEYLNTIFKEKLKAVQEVINKSDTKPIGH